MKPKPFAVVLALIVILPLINTAIITADDQNYYSDVEKISRTYSNNQLYWIPGNTHTIPTGAMELKYYLSRTYSDTSDWVFSTEFTFEAIWAYSNDYRGRGAVYYIGYVHEFPAYIKAVNYRVSVMNTYYTWGRDYLQEVSFNSIYAYDEDVGESQASDTVANTIMSALSIAWDFVVASIEIPLPAPWQVLQTQNPQNYGINIPTQIDFNHDQINDINSHYDYNLPPLTYNQYYRRNFGLRESVRIEYAFDPVYSPQACGIVFLWSFQPDIKVISPSIATINVPQGYEPILYAYVEHNIYYFPPTGSNPQ